MAVQFNLDGQVYSFPDWASESTQQQIKDILAAMAKNNGVSDATLKKLLKSTDDLVDNFKDEFKETKKRGEDQKDRDEKALKASKEFGEGLKTLGDKIDDFGDNLEAPTGFFGRVRDNLEADGELLGGTIAEVGRKVAIAGSAIGATLVGASAFVFNRLSKAGETVNELVSAGVGFNTTYAEVGMTTTQAMGYLGALGLGFEGAAELIKRNSSVVATQGFKRFNDTMKFAADVSEDLGKSFEDSMETFGDALNRRQTLLNLGNVSQQRVNQTVATTVKMQTAYATALGVSTETLAAFVDSLVRDNGLLSSSLLRFNDTVRNDVVAGIEVFASGMAAMGGKAGQDIASAFLEAGSAGAIGLSDAAVGIVTALPQLQGPMNEFINGIQNGTLSQEQANSMIQDITSDLGNLSDTEKQRIQALARTGDASAQMMANAIAQFEQSESKIKDINKALGTGFSMDLVQKGTNNFNKIMAQVSGGAQNAFYSLFANPEVLSIIEDGMKEIMGAFGFGVDSMSGIAQEGGKALGEKFLPMLKSAVSFLSDQLKKVAEYVKGFRDDSGNIDFGALFSDIFDKAKDAVIGSLIKGVTLFAVTLFGFSMAKEFAKSILMPQMTKFMGGIFDKASGSLGNVAAKGAQGVMGALGTAGEKLSGVAGSVTEKVSGSKYGKIASEKLGGFMKKGEGMTEKLSSSMTGGGKSGGFLTKIADAVKEFGDNKVVKGAASLTLLGGALALTAVGLKTFNEVEWESLVKGGVALYGLIKIAEQVGEGSNDMIKGAAGIAILGASLIPAAYGLQMFNNVDWMSLAKGGVALLGLAEMAEMVGDKSTDMAKGAVGIALLGASLIPAAVGLRMFNEVDWGSLIKGGVALVGLAETAKLLGNQTASIVKGAVAVGILGASIIPLAVGLNMMNNVGIGTIGVLAASLITLGAAGAVLGSVVPLILSGSVAIAALGASIIPLAVGLQLMQGVGIDTVGVLASSLVTLGAAAAALGLGLPFILAGAAAIGALGVALVPFAIGATMAGAGSKMLASGMKDLAGIPMADIASGLLTLGGAMTLMLPLIPGIVLTGAALGVAGVALIPFALGAALAAGPAESLADALMLLNFVDAGQLVNLSTGILSLGGAMTVLGLALPFIMLAGVAAEPIKELAFALIPLSVVNFANLLMAGAALESLGSGMSALSGGSLMSSLKDGIGSLFGADSPVDKLREFIEELSKLDIGPLLSTAYAFDILLTSSEKLPEFGAMLSVISKYTEPFVEQMSLLSRSIKRMGEDPFASFGTLDTHAESMTTFATSAEQLTKALDAINGEYVGTHFYAIGEGIQYMVEQMDELNMGDIVKLGAMKLFGPSKEEKEAEAKATTKRIAIKDTAQEKLYGGLGFDGDGGLTRLLKGLNSVGGQGVRDSALYIGAQPHNYALAQATNLESYGVSVDREAILAGGETAQSAIADITRQLGTMIDAYKMQEKTGIDHSAVPTVGRAPQVETPTTQQIPGAAETAAGNMTPPDQGGPTQIELLTELVRLQAENNRLAKKQVTGIENIEV